MITAAKMRVPDSLAELDQWIVWRYEQRDDGKPTKVPYQIKGSRASSTDANTWRSFDRALKTARQYPIRWFGVGFVFSATDPFFGIDLEHLDSYAGISRGGSGIDIWAKGGGCRTAALLFPWATAPSTFTNQGRYSPVIGKHRHRDENRFVPGKCWRPR